MSATQRNYSRELEIAKMAVRQAGRILLGEYSLPGGPRGRDGHCSADSQAESAIREQLKASFPHYGIIGEELPDLNTPGDDPEGHLWMIDPNDGTASYLKGWRGPSVSLGLMRCDLPVLGVVLVYGARAGSGDEFAWAEGEVFTRNGVPVKKSDQTVLNARSTILVSQSADNNPRSNANLAYPARFRTEPSIAHRLALVAAGEGVAAVSLNSPSDFDVVAGHALLRAVGYDLFRMGGEPVRYNQDGRGVVGDCVGGVPAIARELSYKNWDDVFSIPEKDSAPYPLVFPDRECIVSETTILLRGQGCLLGQFIGDSLGSLVEFQSAESIAELYADGPRDLVDGGAWNTIGGQLTDDSELALMLARSIVSKGTYDREDVARAYAYWLESNPFDVGTTTRNALEPAFQAMKERESSALAAEKAATRFARSQANGALMRISPLAIFGWRLAPPQLVAFAAADAALTHSHPICREANAIFCLAIADLIRASGNPSATHQYVLQWAENNEVDEVLLTALRRAPHQPPEDFQTTMGWVVIALQNAFYQLLNARNLEEGIVNTVAAGGDTDTNGAIAGALLGAFWGADAFPHRWIDRIITCRPLSSLRSVRHPRPLPFWTVDCLRLAERLLWLGNRAIEPGLGEPNPVGP